MKSCPGGSTRSVGITKYAELPANARRYLERMQEIVGVPVDISLHAVRQR